jgi:hypothetical protein
MGKDDLDDKVKTKTHEKWLIVTLNWRCYKHPHVTPPNLNVNLTLFECHEPPFHTHHESLCQIDKD